MSLFTLTKYQPKVNFSEYIHTQNEDKPDAQPTNPAEPTKPSTPEAE